MVGVGGAMTALGGQASAQRDALPDDLTIEQLDGPASDDAVETATRDTETARILSRLDAKGWTRTDSVAFRTALRNRRYETVAFTLETRERTEVDDAFLIWSELEDVPAIAYLVDRDGGADDEVRFTSYYVENGRVTTYTGLDTVEPDKSEVEGDFICAPQYTCPGGADIPCIVKVAGATAAAGEICAACAADPTKLTCIGCAGALIVAGVDAVFNCCPSGWDCLFCCP